MLGRHHRRQQPGARLAGAVRQGIRRAHASGKDIGRAEVLARYGELHRRTTLPTYLGTNAIVKLFTTEFGPARLDRQAVLTLSESLPPFNKVGKAAITRQLTGRGGITLAGRPR